MIKRLCGVRGCFASSDVRVFVVLVCLVGLFGGSGFVIAGDSPVFVSSCWETEPNAVVGSYTQIELDINGAYDGWGTINTPVEYFISCDECPPYYFRFCYLNRWLRAGYDFDPLDPIVSVIDTQLVPGKPYTFRLKARDFCGNESGYAGDVTVFPGQNVTLVPTQTQWQEVPYDNTESIFGGNVISMVAEKPTFPSLPDILFDIDGYLTVVYKFDRIDPDSGEVIITSGWQQNWNENDDDYKAEPWKWSDTDSLKQWQEYTYQAHAKLIFVDQMANDLTRDIKCSTVTEPKSAVVSDAVFQTGCSVVDLRLDGVIKLEDFTILAEYWVAAEIDPGSDVGSCNSDNFWCYGADINTDSYVDMIDLSAMYMCWLIQDEQSPLPERPVWVVEPRAVQNSFTQVEMQLGEIHDAWWPDEYLEFYVECADCPDTKDYWYLNNWFNADDWINKIFIEDVTADPTVINEAEGIVEFLNPELLTPGLKYTFKLKARDGSGNETEYTTKDVIPGENIVLSPEASSWQEPPHCECSVGPSDQYIEMQAVQPSFPSLQYGVDGYLTVAYKFDRINPYSGWVIECSPWQQNWNPNAYDGSYVAEPWNWIDTSETLLAGNEYTYQVSTKLLYIDEANGGVVRTVRTTDPSAMASAILDEYNDDIPTPNPATIANIELITYLGIDYLRITATEATHDLGVEYQFQHVTVSTVCEEQVVTPTDLLEGQNLHKWYWGYLADDFFDYQLPKDLEPGDTQFGYYVVPNVIIVNANLCGNSAFFRVRYRSHGGIPIPGEWSEPMSRGDFLGQ